MLLDPIFERFVGVLPAGEQKVIPPVPVWEVGQRALKNTRWRSVNAGREPEEAVLVDGR